MKYHINSAEQNHSVAKRYLLLKRTQNLKYFQREGRKGDYDTSALLPLAKDKQQTAIFGKIVIFHSKLCSRSWLTTEKYLWNRMWWSMYAENLTYYKAVGSKLSNISKLIFNCIMSSTFWIKCRSKYSLNIEITTESEKLRQSRKISKIKFVKHLLSKHKHGYQNRNRNIFTFSFTDICSLLPHGNHLLVTTLLFISRKFHSSG